MVPDCDIHRHFLVGDYLSWFHICSNTLSRWRRIHGLVRGGYLVEHGEFVGTEFQLKVWNALKKIPEGEVWTYTQLAKFIGHPNSRRAVANACGANPYPIIIPCHRVIRSDGSIGGYSGKGGVETKRKLLSEEGVTVGF